MKQEVAIVAGEVLELNAGVRRLTAPNPGMMTGPGTNTYIIGNTQLAIIDPGPVIDSHLQQLAGIGDVRWIIATHTHPDHSPGARLLAELTGASLIGMPPPQQAHQDQSFEPSQIPVDGDILEGPDFRLHLLHTPGHASNHICILHDHYRWLFTGDHVMNGSTVVIDPPDGDMTDYLQSLRRLRDEDIQSIAPGHGPLFHNPVEVIDDIIAHRLKREAGVRAALASNYDLSSMELVPHVYQDVDQKLYTWAERSLLAHLLKLERDGEARQLNGLWRAIEG